MTENPFNPGWGVTPPVFAGRDAVFHDLLANLNRGPGRSTYVNIVVGPRGVGKTVLLHRIRGHVQAEYGWLAIMWPANAQTLAEAVGEAYPAIREELLGRRSRLAGGEFSVGAGPIGGTLQFGGRPTPTSVVGQLRDLGQTAADRGTHVVVFVDELQAGDDMSLQQLAGALQETNATGLPVALVADGLPTTRERLASVKKITFLERQDQILLGNLDWDSTIAAIEEPIRQARREITTDALRRLADYTAGYPYAIQLVGEHAWNVSGGAVTITSDHAEASIEATSEMLSQIFEGRWNALSPSERRYMVAFAQAATNRSMANTGNIAELMGQAATTVSKYRDRLIREHQLLYRVNHGVVASALPGFLGWVRRHGVSVDRTARRELIEPSGFDV